MIKRKFMTSKKAFTLIELLVVIGIIAILATVVFVALNPVQRFADARNSRRFTDVNNLITEIHECIVDNDGGTTPCLGSLVAGTKYEIVSNGSSGCNAVCTNVAASANCADLDTNLSSYLKELPTDPGDVTTGHTEYEVVIDSNNIVTITSCSAESPETYGVTDTIKVSR